jgi:hypothetical protein
MEACAMLRLLPTTVVVLLLAAGGLHAAEVKGKIKSVDAEKAIVTVTVDEKDQDFMIPAAAKITILDAVSVREAKDGLKDPVFKMVKGALATITTEQKDGKEVVTKMEVNTNRVD